MASEIKVNNIKDQCGTAVITKCGATHTVTAEVYKADTIQDTSGNAYLAKCGSTVTLGGCGQTIELAAGASQTGFGRTGTVDWDTTAKTASFTAVSGNGYFVNTTSGAVTMTLPASPSAGDIVAVSDYAQTSTTNNITVARNSSNIEGDASDLVIARNGVAMTLVYVDGTRGWKVVDSGAESDKAPAPEYIVATGGTITCCGDYKIHTFTGPGTFTVTCAGNPLGSDTVDTLLVAGGAGAGGNLAGGGGAGGVVLIASCNATALTAQAYPITVGAGGAGAPSNAPGNSGSNTTGLSLTAIGGGTSGPASTGAAGTPGGSGGGAAGGSSASITSGGTATQPTQPGNSGTYGFGSNGGNRTPAGAAANGGGAGGGGGSAVGSNMPGTGPGGPGGSGKDATPIFGASPKPFYGPTNGVYAGGGGAGANPGTGGSGGSGGGGNGGTSPGVGGSAGTTNTGGGGGGGGGGNGAGGAGGSGIVIIRYKFQ
jgi:hypothetical protein